MILGIDELHKLVKEKKLVEDLSERELKNPEGAGFDLRIGELYELKSGGYLGIEKRETSDLNLIAKYEGGKITIIELKPRTYYVMKTLEKVNTPKNILILFRTRTNLFRSGVKLITGACAPGYNGELTFGIENTSEYPFTLEMGARVAHAMFHLVKGETKLYRGQWQGGRVKTDGEETQI
ncbi:MAG: hypothetical protein KJ623_02715 [Nanoarchaeota archaeon]|nr:hypothetical protein [Nanoarchaeota archaeon]MBU0962525.1 hypothetical protein [Nanoarchaeota archaeon]